MRRTLYWASVEFRPKFAGGRRCCGKADIHTHNSTKRTTQSVFQRFKTRIEEAKHERVWGIRISSRVPAGGTAQLGASHFYFSIDCGG